MPRPAAASVLMVAPFDQGLNAHSGMRARALERLGLGVAQFNLLQRSRWWGVRRKDSGSLLGRALGRADYRLVLMVGPPPFESDTILQLRRSSDARWVMWLPGPAPPPQRLQQALVAFDLLAVGGTDVAADLAQRGVGAVRYLPSGCDPSFHRPLRARDRFRANVVFAGKATPRREKLLAAVVEFGLAIWGPGWRRTSLREYCRGQLLSAADYVRAYSGASVALNIHHDLDGVGQAGVNQRLFELAAMGACQVVDRRDDLGRHFEHGRHLRCFDEAEELRAAVKRSLLEAQESDRMGREARRVAIGNHTYMHRLKQLLEWVAAD